MEENKRDYLSEGWNTLNEEKMKKLLHSLKNTEVVDNIMDISYLLGYEKACKLKDEENQNNIDLINKINTDKIVNSFCKIEPLIKFLKNDDDAYVKGKIITELTELMNYVSNTLNESEVR